MISSESIKDLRDKTGISVMECKKALEEAAGDMARALKVLDKRFGGMASKKASRETNAGIVDAYIHSNGKIGVLLELFSETDFVAKHEEFRALAHEISLHIAATNPQYRSPEDAPEASIAEIQKEIADEVAKMGKPAEMAGQIAKGKLEARLAEMSLLTQPFVKDPDKKVSDIIEGAIGKFGENIKVGQFVRYSI